MAKKKKGKSKKGKNSSSDSNFAVIGQYLVAKNKKTKYIKFEAQPKASKEVKAMVKKLIAALGTEAVYVNLITEDAREKYDIPSFVKGRISVNLDPKDIDDEDEDEDEDDEDDEDEDEDDEDEDDDEEDDDEDEEDDDEDEDDSDF